MAITDSQDLSSLVVYKGQYNVNLRWCPPVQIITQDCVGGKEVESIPLISYLNLFPWDVGIRNFNDQDLEERLATLNTTIQEMEESDAPKATLLKFTEQRNNVKRLLGIRDTLAQQIVTKTFDYQEKNLEFLLPFMEQKKLEAQQKRDEEEGLQPQSRSVQLERDRANNGGSTPAERDRRIRELKAYSDDLMEAIKNALP